MFQRLCLLQNAFNQTSKTVEMTRALLILRLRGFVVGGRTQEREGTWFKLVRPVFVQNIQSHPTSLLPYYSESMIDSKRL